MKASELAQRARNGNTCKDCKYWNYYPENVEANEFSECNYATWASWKTGVTDRLARAENIMDGTDGEFLTKPDFGCNQFKEKSE